MLKLYRDGNTHNANGIACQIRLFTEGEAIDAMRSGWVGRVEDIGNDQQEAEEESPKKTKSRAKRISRAAVLELRQRGQDAGVPNWESLPVDRLRKALAG